MSTISNIRNAGSNGLRQQRAARLRAAVEGTASRKDASPADFAPTANSAATILSLATKNTTQGMGLRQQRAAELKARLEAPQQEVQTDTAQEVTTVAQSGGPVGTGDHLVKQGECLSSIAKNTGHFWQTIWDDPSNSQLKDVRRNPNVLLAEDRVTIPKIEPKYEAGQTEQRHRFVRLGEPSRLALVVKSKGEPVGNAPYTIDIDGRSQFSGTTDPAGAIDVPIPGDARTAVVTVERPKLGPKVYRLRLGGLDPITTNTGVQARLNNLGYACGSEKGEIGPKTLAALNSFCAAVGMPTSGELDDGTRQELENVHDRRRDIPPKASQPQAGNPGSVL